MRNFILFIRRFFNLILFLILEIVCLLLISKTNTLQGNDLISSANRVSGLLYKKQNDVVYYFGLRRLNDSLLNENARLRAQLALYTSTDTLKDSLVHRPISTDTTHMVRYADYVYRSARVINNSVTAANNYITINRGTSTGLAKGMAVITGSGAVGQIIHISKNYASILSILNKQRLVSAQLKDGTTGAVGWNGEKPDIMSMKDVSQQMHVKTGDSVFTTSYSFFPPGILIGTVIRLEVENKSNMETLHIKPSVNFRNLQYVYVVENKMLPERKQLEDSAKAK